VPDLVPHHRKGEARVFTLEFNWLPHLTHLPYKIDMSSAFTMPRTPTTRALAMFGKSRLRTSCVWPLSSLFI
jgi:hypothetical protein